MELIWITLSVIVPLLIGLGVTFAMSDSSHGEFLFARGCFILSGLILLIWTGYWLLQTESGFVHRIIVGGLVGALVTAGLPESLRWVTGRETKIIAKQQSDEEVTKSAAPSEPKAFSAITSWGMAYSSGAGAIRYVQNSEITPISYATLVKFTNLRSVPMMIDTYILETERDDGTWEASSLPLGAGGTFYMGRNPKAVSAIKYKTLDSAFQDKNIAPNETVVGWIFFLRWPPAPSRMRIKDASGNTFTEPITMGSTDGGWPVQPMEAELTKETEDISALPMSNAARYVSLPPEPIIDKEGKSSLPVVEWRPPQIPESCDKVTVALGGAAITYDVSLLVHKKVSLDFGITAGKQGIVLNTLNLNSGQQIPIADMEKGPPTLVPIFLTVVDDRLYVECTIPYNGGQITIKGNSPKTEIPQDWDWNHNDAAMEIVNEKQIPVFQIIYDRPEKISICGLFAIGSDLVQFNTTPVINIVVDGKYDPAWIKPLFKYPSGLYPGQLAQ